MKRTKLEPGDPIMDKIGQEIKPGDIICYGHSLGRSAGLAIGKVMRVGIKQNESWQDDEYRITVLGVDDSPWDQPIGAPPRFNSKKGTIQYPDRCVVVAPTLVPPKYMKLFEKVEPE